MVRSSASSVAYWIKERESIRRLHDSGAPRPWTKDEVLGTYRFCNVRREDDKVTRWIKKNWRDPYANHPNLTVAMVLARLLNWPPTLDAIGFPTQPWDKHLEEYYIRVIQDLMHVSKTWGSAYVVTTCGKPMDKAVYAVQNVCGGVAYACIAPRPGDTLRTFWEGLRLVDGLGAGFLAAQVVADLKYVEGNPLASAEDWWTFAVPGPGSRRGINRYYGRDANAPLSDEQWGREFRAMILEVTPLIPRHIGNIHAQDWQNVMCEWDKYQRTWENEGRPKRRYSPETAYDV